MNLQILLRTTTRVTKHAVWGIKTAICLIFTQLAHLAEGWRRPALGGVHVSLAGLSAYCPAVVRPQHVDMCSTAARDVVAPVLTQYEYLSWRH